MKALVLEEPGDPPRLAVQEVPLPQLGPRDVLVRVTACGFCHHDYLVMRGVLRRGVKRQVVLGHEIAGEVEMCGSAVTGLSPGDRSGFPPHERLRRVFHVLPWPGTPLSAGLRHWTLCGRRICRVCSRERAQPG